MCSVELVTAMKAREQMLGEILAGNQFVVLGKRAKFSIEWIDGPPGSFDAQSLRDYGLTLAGDRTEGAPT